MAKKIKITIKILLTIIICAVSYILISTPFQEIRQLPKIASITYDGIHELNKEKPFGRFVTFKQNHELYASTTQSNDIIDIKLLNLFSLKKIKVALNSYQVYAGGDAVGFSLNSKGVVLIGHSNIVTTNGKVDTLKNSKLAVGDIITHLNNIPVEKVSDINNIFNSIENKTDPVSVKAIRNNEEFESTITPALDVYTNTYKLGIWVKDETSGVGTLTYVKKDDGSFGALGHAICDNETSKPFNVQSGDMFPCTILGIKKGSKGNPGEIKALFLQKNPIGCVKKNTKFGIFGKINTNNNFLNNKEVFSTGGRLTARPGKAKIRSNISGEVKDYDIEIIKTNYQNASNEKSLVLKVTDKDLLKLTGGIVQGMSGSPIIQNGKIIGAVTHVFINDPTKGFGIYLDWMIEN